ncbi:MAG: DUF2088 domain-containing protein [Candidatus Latescibacteria bacterium]|nr:DUF2088 domain-containing protein [Candidatus Latescibacterota bacterium]
MIQLTAPPNSQLDEATIRQALISALEGCYQKQKVLVLIPDHTRTVPLPLLFRCLTEGLHDSSQLDFMVALGTHPPLDDVKLRQLVGIDQASRETTYRHIGLLNHLWDTSDALATIGSISQDHIRAMAGDRWHPSLGNDVPVRISKAILNYDHVIILGPTFPHEVAGFSGGAKYFFPGISGPEMINTTHWLGALAGVRGTIGIQDTPVRAMIHAAAEMISTPSTLIGLVTENDGLAGMFIGNYLEAWSAAANLSAERHIIWVDRPFDRILSCAPSMYDELWTAGKAMYKLEPALAEDGELIIYAPDLEVVSHVHGKHIYEVGYHVLPYFLNQWNRFKHVPLGVLAHSTHVRGEGTYRNEVEYPRASVSLATSLPPESCRKLSLGYTDPTTIDTSEWSHKEEDGVLYVRKAGEMLYRVRPK